MTGFVQRAFLRAACVPLDGTSHQTGSLDAAEVIRGANPGIESTSIHVAAALGAADEIERFIAEDPATAIATEEPDGWDPLTVLCFSRYLRLAPERSADFVRSARLLLEAGADAASGFFDPSHEPSPVFESVLYGAAGVAHHAELTRLLLEHGADPNDDETPYHAPETYDDGVLQALLDSGRLTAASLATMLVRKADWHDLGGIRMLLEHGADPNRITPWGITPLQQAIRRDNALAIVDLLLDHESEASAPEFAASDAVQLAAERGRDDVLDSMERRGLPIPNEGIVGLLAACARGDSDTAHVVVRTEPDVMPKLLNVGGTHLALFAGNGNSVGVRLLLDLGVPVMSRFAHGDGYFDIATASTALHVAAWRARHDTVRLLIERGASVNATDGAGRTPMMLAVRACIDSYWTDRRRPDSVAALLAAGGSSTGITLPTGYAEIDELLMA